MAFEIIKLTYLLEHNLLSYVLCFAEHSKCQRITGVYEIAQ